MILILFVVFLIICSISLKIFSSMMNISLRLIILLILWSIKFLKITSHFIHMFWTIIPLMLIIMSGSILSHIRSIMLLTIILIILILVTLSILETSLILLLVLIDTILLLLIVKIQFLILILITFVSITILILLEIYFI